MNTTDEAVRANRLRWWGHVTRMGEATLPERLRDLAVGDKRSRGRPRRRYWDSVKNDSEVTSLTSDETPMLALTRGSWRILLGGLCSSLNAERHSQPMMMMMMMMNSFIRAHVSAEVV